MSLLFSSSANHPSEEFLALYSRGDLPLVLRLRLRSHIAACAECEHQVGLFGSTVAQLKREAASETLTAFEAIADWNTLEREMLGNVVVGVAAARCIDKVHKKRNWLPRLAIGAGLGGLFTAGWVTHIPLEQTQNLTSSLLRFTGLQPAPRPANVVETTPNGISVRSDGVTLKIMHPSSAVVSLSGPSSVEARYVDEDTGQLTITSVYGQ